ncbi:unnamed protein product [Protopolystoma xenopodis]|uniref:ATP citrate synthase n=1 Tax=Protopolystoma xenopodis TaxID=117903 RepID=A0A448XNR8_9PLAT|nr:unnamed protein product [Protopolystoma xenopodis]
MSLPKGIQLGLPLFVFGPETHMTAIVSMALGLREIPDAGTISSAAFVRPALSIGSALVHTGDFRGPKHSPKAQVRFIFGFTLNLYCSSYLRYKHDFASILEVLNFFTASLGQP